MQQLKDTTVDLVSSTFSTDKWLTRLIVSIAAGFSSLQANGGTWPGYVAGADGAAGHWLPIADVTYRWAAWLIVIGLAWVNWGSKKPPTP